MYNLRSYAAMIHDSRRIEGYQRAIQRSVTDGSVVVDIGTGLGIFALLACQAGARKVYAIEPSEVIAVARHLAVANGYQDRIEFIEDLSTRITLPEPADVIVSDMSGAVPLFQHHLPSICDARKRFLKPNGILIPQCDTLWAAVVHAPRAYEALSPQIDRDLGLDMGFAWKMAANVSSNKHFTQADVLTTPAPLAVLDYTTIENPNIHTQLSPPVLRPGVGHGISLWFARTLVEGVSYSTAPDEPEMIYGGLFLPWLEPVELEKNDTIQLDIRADLQPNDYIWSWNTTVSHEGTVKCAFRQSDFFGEPRSSSRLHKQYSTHAPQLNETGETERLILGLMDGRNTIDCIARKLQEAFPSRFPALHAAIGYVGDVSRKYSL